MEILRAGAACVVIFGVFASMPLLVTRR